MNHSYLLSKLTSNVLVITGVVVYVNFALSVLFLIYAIPVDAIFGGKNGQVIGDEVGNEGVLWVIDKYVTVKHIINGGMILTHIGIKVVGLGNIEYHIFGSAPIYTMSSPPDVISA